MHKQIGSFKHNPTQKLYKNLNNFEKPQKTFKNPQKLRSERMKYMMNERKRIIPEEENNLLAKDQTGKVKRLSEKCLGERKEIFYQEKSERNEMKFAPNL